MVKRELLAAATAMVLLAGCSGAGPSGDPDESNLIGEASFALTNVPSDVRCVKVTVTGARTVTRLVDATPGESTTFTIGGLPIGVDVFAEEAFANPCGFVAAGSIASWISDPVTVTLLVGETTTVDIVLHRNGRAVVNSDFRDDHTTATGVCIVRDEFTDLVNFFAPDVGPGYAKTAVPGVNTIDGLLAACTDATYQNLVAAHCATGTTAVQAEIATYENDGSFNTLGCGSIGCDFIPCP